MRRERREVPIGNQVVDETNRGGRGVSAGYEEAEFHVERKCVSGEVRTRHEQEASIGNGELRVERCPPSVLRWALRGGPGKHSTRGKCLCSEAADAVKRQGAPRLGRRLDDQVDSCAAPVGANQGVGHEVYSVDREASDDQPVVRGVYHLAERLSAHADGYVIGWRSRPDEFCSAGP